MTKRSKRVLIAMAVAGGLIAVLAAGFFAAAPRWIRGAIERAAGTALGRDLKIEGAFDVSLSGTPSLYASDITLANASWGSQPTMARVGHLRVAVDLASLWRGPLRVRELVVEDVHVLLESDDGRRNWVFAPPLRREPESLSARPPVVIERAEIRRFELTYRPPRGAPPFLAGIRMLDATLDPATRMIDVRGGGHFGDAPWDIEGRLGPLEHLVEGHDLEQSLSGHVGRAAVTVDGRIRDPMTLGGPNVEVSVDGPDVATALGVFGLGSPLTGPFRLHGVFTQKNDGVGVELSGAVGGVTAAARGTVTALLDPVSIDAAIDAGGSHASEIGSWTGVVGLPPLPFDLAGRVHRDGPRLSVEDVQLHVGGTSLTVDGTLGELPRCVGADLKVVATGPNLRELSALTRVNLPEGRFGVSGRFLRRADGLAIDAAQVAVQGAVVHASGTIGEPPALANFDLAADVAGPDASCLSGVARFELPAEPFELRGRVVRNGPELELDAVSGRLGGDTFELSGQIAPVGGLVGTSAHVRLHGNDLREIASHLGVHGVPAQSYEAVGAVRVAADHYALDDIDARVGGLTLRVDGKMGKPSALDGTALTLRVRGKALSDLAAWGVPAELPPDPFAASGRLLVEGGVYRLDDATAELGADRVAVDGTLGALPNLDALDVAMTASGPSLAGVGRFAAAAGADVPARIPAEPYTVSGRARRVPSGLEVEGIKAEVGSLKLGASGLLSFETRSLGTDLTFDTEAPDTSTLSKAIGMALPDGALRAKGRFRRTSDGLQLDGIEVSIGASYAELTGVVGDPPRFAGTDLDASVEGPDLAALLGPWTGSAPLPPESFAVAAHVEGSTERFALDRLNARLGDSDLTGSAWLRLAGRPFFDADLSSKRFDVPRLIAGFTREPESGPGENKPAKRNRNKGDRLIPDWPLELGTLGTFDARLRLDAAEIPFAGIPVRDVAIAGRLDHGALTIDHADGTAKNGGRATSALSLHPEGDGYRLHAEGRLDGGRLDLSKTGQAPELAPSLDLEYEFDGAGRSLHDVAASADGHILGTLGPGRIPNTLTEFMSSGVFAALLDALNPFRKSSPYTALECGIAAAGIDGGKMVVQPIAARTDKMTVVGNGKVDFGTERIDLVWTIKPRRGVGISGGSIANPYIKLGGTLAAPSLDLKPLEAVASTSAAVVTAGLTILFRGIYDRITAEKKVCVEALAKARKQIEEREVRKNAPSGD